MAHAGWPKKQAKGDVKLKANGRTRGLEVEKYKDGGSNGVGCCGNGQGNGSGRGG